MFYNIKVFVQCKVPLKRENAEWLFQGRLNNLPWVNIGLYINLQSF